MGNTEHLFVLRQLAQLLSNLLGCTTGNAGVHLIKNQSANLVFLRQHIFHGEHDSSQLTAGGHLAHGL